MVAGTQVQKSIQLREAQDALWKQPNPKFDPGITVLL